MLPLSRGLLSKILGSGRESALDRRRKESGASMPRRPKSPSGDDVSAATRFVGVGGDCFVGFEVQIALDG